MRGLCTAVVLLSSSLPIVAGTTWDETTNGGGDAANLPATAQIIQAAGGGALIEITGNISATSDADMYVFRIANSAVFSADTSITPGTLTDPQMFLFQLSGMGVAGCDDFTGLFPVFPVGNALYNTLPAGSYLIAVSGFNFDPQSTGGGIFPGGGVVGPTGPGGGLPVSSWSVSSSGTGTYRITLTGAEFITNNPPTIVLSATTSFTGNATAGFDVSVAQGAALTNANLNLDDPEGATIDVNSITPAPSAITGVTAPTPAVDQADGTTISWTGTVSATQATGVYTYTVVIDDDFNPNVTVAVRITVTAAGGGGGGGGGAGRGTRGGGGGTANIFAGCLAAEGTPGIAFAALAVALALALRRSA